MPGYPVDVQRVRSGWQEIASAADDRVLAAVDPAGRAGAGEVAVEQLGGAFEAGRGARGGWAGPG